LNRDKAITIISKQELMLLSREERESILLDCWSIDDEDTEFYILPESLQKELLEYDEPNDVMNSKYNSLILNYLKHKYIGVRNEYLSKKVSELQRQVINVEGNQEKLFICPCCGYLTLEERNQYYICKVCFWEDDGNDDPLRYSNPNHITLREAQENFSKYGACTRESVKFVVLDAKERYYRSED
jgi:ribosomal protein L37AE/L43A